MFLGGALDAKNVAPAVLFCQGVVPLSALMLFCALPHCSPALRRSPLAVCFLPVKDPLLCAPAAPLEREKAKNVRLSAGGCKMCEHDAWSINRFLNY